MSARSLLPGATALAVAVVLLLPAPPAEAHSTRSSWSYSNLIRRIEGARVPLRGTRVRINPDLVICNGEGTVFRRRGVRRWKHFTCTQTLFRRGLDRDVTFRVHVLGPKRFRLSNARYGPS